MTDQELQEKAKRENVDLSELPAEIIKAFENDYVESVRNGRLIYSQKFYQDMYKYIKEQKMTYVQAYKKCGFDVKALGKDRANAAGKRAFAMGKNGSLWRIQPTEMDATIPLNRMDPDMDDAHRMAYLQARCMYLEAELEYEKEKKRSAYQEARSRLLKMMEEK